MKPQFGIVLAVAFNAFAAGFAVRGFLQAIADQPENWTTPASGIAAIISTVTTVILLALIHREVSE